MNAVAAAGVGEAVEREYQTLGVDGLISVEINWLIRQGFQLGQRKAEPNAAYLYRNNWRIKIVPKGSPEPECWRVRNKEDSDRLLKVLREDAEFLHLPDYQIRDQYGLEETFMHVSSRLYLKIIVSNCAIFPPRE